VLHDTVSGHKESVILKKENVLEKDVDLKANQ
jgi:hypothetical protein